METIQEKKQKQAEKVKNKLKHLEEHCVLTFEGLEQDNVYFHPVITIEKGVTIRMQCDVGSNYNYDNVFYCPTFSSVNDNIFSVKLDENLVDNVVLVWKNNKESVIIAFDTLNKIGKHVDKLRNYTNDYITNLLIGNSVNDLSKDFINEIKTTTSVINFMQKNTK